MAEEETSTLSDNNAAVFRAALSDHDADVPMELLALGRRGSLISQARKQVLQILETENSCAAWLSEAQPAAAEVFRSLHYKLDGHGTFETSSIPDGHGGRLFKHPWGARSLEYAGSNSVITINSKGPFFVEDSPLTKLTPTGGPAIPIGWFPETIGPFWGGTPQARTVILLHELGHIIGILPPDNDSWNGESSRNTIEVLRHCKDEIKLTARKDSRRGKRN